MSATPPAGTQGTTATDWTCDCGQVYRIAVRDERGTLWPRNSAAGFSTHGLGTDEACVRCGKPLDAAPMH
jgi:hypothetical protein